MLERERRESCKKVTMEKQAEEEENPNSHADLINTFCEIASASREEALFFLESHNFNLDAAVSTFLETSSSATAVATVPPSQSPPSSASPSRSRSPSPPPALRSHPNPYSLRSRHRKKKPSGSRTGGVRTLSDLNRPSTDGSGSDSDDQPQEYYTGGEKSGMLVQDPSKVNDVDAIFTQARQAGAVEGPLENLHPSSSSRSFTGTGRLLSGETVSSAPQQPEVVTRNIIFWSDGFTVDDGPLRRLDDPENASFLEDAILWFPYISMQSISKSECPKELEPADRRTAVHVNLMRKEENFPIPEKHLLAFQGVGRTLSSTTTSTEPTVATTSFNTAPTPSMGLVVDDALPSTSIQLRLADGTRMVSRFNYHHTIRDIRTFIDASRPGGARTYQLQTVGFPPKQLTDLDQSIEQAGLANSVVIQKL
ncbi:plant UBX domain-containing protein 4-like isoform X1 [Camellia sinensis]|uniref:plant UBX domain-containing protein 4-like isoform X1 n=1 Tax=Camellia sinensis TaxID=4442 RepID=UPI001036A3BB|nr:plant UBX domain-containing protein 4-like isoform X1 [Camellia sinensis]